MNEADSMDLVMCIEALHLLQNMHGGGGVGGGLPNVKHQNWVIM